MKYTLIILSLAAMFASCSKTIIPYERSGEVNAVSHENSIIVLSSQARAESASKAVYHAERNAFENLIFKGIPNTNQESPMVPSEVKALRDNPSLFNSLLVEQGYRRYVMDSYTNNSVAVGGGVQLIDQVVKIDLKALRNYLQAEGVTKKFGL